MKKQIIYFSFLVMLIDQISKLIITYIIILNDNIQVIKNFFYLTYIQNEGAAWNLLYGNRWFLVLFSLFALYIVIKYFLLDINIVLKEKIGYILLIGGILGNLVDRVIYGYVIDWLDFYIFGYNYPVFNIADASIVIGSILVIWGLLKGSKK